MHGRRVVFSVLISSCKISFSTDSDYFGKTQVVDLIPNGRSIPVTEENKHEYVKLVCEYKILHGVKTQIESFLEGFHELVPPKFLTIFDDKVRVIERAGMWLFVPWCGCALVSLSVCPHRY